MCNGLDPTIETQHIHTHLGQLDCLRSDSYVQCSRLSYLLDSVTDTHWRKGTLACTHARTHTHMQSLTNLVKGLLSVRLQFCGQLHAREVGLQQQVGFGVGVVELGVGLLVRKSRCQLKVATRIEQILQCSNNNEGQQIHVPLALCHLSSLNTQFTTLCKQRNYFQLLSEIFVKIKPHLDVLVMCL